MTDLAQCYQVHVNYENLAFDFKVECPCDVGSENDLERISCSIAIDRFRVFARPRPRADHRRFDRRIPKINCSRRIQQVPMLLVWGRRSVVVQGMAGHETA